MGQASTISALYDCNLPTKVNADLFIFIGTSLMNGYAASYTPLDSTLKDHYFPSGDLTYCERFGTDGSLTIGDLKKGCFEYMNVAHNYSYSSNRFGQDWIFAKTLDEDYNWNRPYFIFDYMANGSSLIAGQSDPDWSIDGAVYPRMITYLTQAVNILKSRGYELRISVMWGNGAIEGTATTNLEYETAMKAFMDGIRTACDDTGVRFYMGKQATFGNAAKIAYNEGIDLVAADDPLFESFDFFDFEVGSDSIHPTTMAYFLMGLIFAGYWNEKYNSNNRPVASNVQITGTLKIGYNISFSYTYSDTDGDLQDTSVVTDAMRIDYGTGTRCEFYYADDNVGTNRTYFNITKNTGQSYQVTYVYEGKYFQAIVHPKALSGSIHGYPVKSAWQGPVVA
jgi:hypothetical protein